ncbi:MAG: hypothetical protein H5T84_10105, partial [Thermoleophilia bacterium]|nr:hypothetical protein [Thermoleophilia bacterium]
MEQGTGTSGASGAAETGGLADRHSDLPAGERLHGGQRPPEGERLPEWERERLAKVEELRRAGIEPYARSFMPRTRLAEIAQAHVDLGPGEKREESRYRVAGRVMARREHGKAVFLTLRDGWDDLQLYGNVDKLGEQS